MNAATTISQQQDTRGFVHNASALHTTPPAHQKPRKRTFHLFRKADILTRQRQLFFLYRLIFLGGRLQQLTWQPTISTLPCARDLGACQGWRRLVTHFYEQHLQHGLSLPVSGKRHRW